MAIATEELPTKELRELARKLKRGYTLERTQRGHFRVRDPQGKLIQSGGRNLTLSSNTAMSATMEAQLKSAGVLRRAEHVRTPRRQAHEQAAIKAMREATKRQTLERRDKARALRERMRPWMKAIGAETPGVVWDIARYLHLKNNGVFVSAESATHAIRNVMEGAGVKDESREALSELSARFEAEPEPLVLYVDIAREARGIDVGDAQLQMPAGSEWPFKMKLVEVEACFADDAYQRPSPERFVREIVLHFDERKVGSIQVSAREDGRSAILDGQTRWRACQIIGKKRVWAAVYEGMNIAAEATFFFEVNKDRKTVHPYYGFRARVLAEEPKATEINTIVKQAGMKLSPNTQAEIGGIAAVAALEFAYNLKSEVREDTLTPGLRILGQTWKGLRRSTDAELIRGFGRFYAAYSDEEIDDERFIELLGGYGPLLVINRARDLVFTTGGSTTGAKASGMTMAKALVDIHNTGLPRARRLDAKRLERFQ